MEAYMEDMARAYDHTEEREARKASIAIGACNYEDAIKHLVLAISARDKASELYGILDQFGEVE